MRTRTVFFLICALSLGTHALPAPSHASNQAQDEAKRRSEAKRLFRAGAAAYATGQYLAAAQALEQSYELIGIAATAFSLAQAYRLQYFIDQDYRHLERSIALYRIYIEEVRSGARRSDAVASLAELEPIKLRLDVEKKKQSVLVPSKIEAYEPPTQIMVVSSSPDAKIVLNNGAPIAAPLIAVVPPGQHVAMVSAPGYTTIKRTIQAVEGRLVVVEIDLKEEPAQVWFNGPPGAQVWLDGRLITSLPQREPITVTAGKHRVMVRQKGRVPWARYMTVERGGTLKIDVILPITVQRQLSYGVMGVGTAGLITAGVVGLLALQEDQEAVLLLTKKDTEVLTATDHERYTQLVDERDAHATGAWLIFGISVAVAGAGSLLYHFDPGQASTKPDGPWLAIVPSNDGFIGGIGARF